MSTFGGLEPQNLPKRSSEQVFGRLGKWAHSGLEPNKQRCLDYSNLIAKLISEQTPKSWHSDDSLKQWPVEPHYLLYPGSPSQPFFEWFWNCKDSIVLVKVYFINNSRGLFFWWFLTPGCVQVIVLLQLFLGIIPSWIMVYVMSGFCFKLLIWLGRLFFKLWYHYLSQRIQVHPNGGITPWIIHIVLWGWHWIPQSYSIRMGLDS